ncbi:MAG TPA: response regulator [Candidatus Eisenbergiella merdavium]|uniref:Stage 0 sporulation protein A homolog n=1 Tax=Candidatus Eisenbergiella merdavium TaxID=2838551 RepID=A0A9D2NFN2_9FIRM|nr:response regulator [Candidatus Eisenbergiella merdavium]
MYRLLVADDEKKLLSGLCDFYPWKDLGFQIVARAENGRRALEYISRNPVDVVLTDIAMPVMTGLELAEILSREHPEIKIVFLSGYMEFRYAQQALRYGVQDYILKPVKTDVLRKTFTELKRKMDQERGLAEAAPGYYGGIVKTVEDYIRSNLKTANLEEASLLVNLSAGYLSALFKKEAGRSFSEALLEARMKKAAELLMRPEYKIYDISEYLGYENSKNFSRAFRGYYGLSPRDFRNGSGNREME